MLVYVYNAFIYQDINVCIARLFELQSSSSSCHQTCVFHLSTQFFAISLKLFRSSNEQGSARRVHCIMCEVFSVAWPHSHVASPSKYPHFCPCSLLHVNPVRSRFRHLHVVHGLSYPLARLSLRLTVNFRGVVCNLLSHSLHRMILRDNSAGFTLRKKQFRISSFSLQGVVHIESGTHWFPVWSFPF